MSQTAWSPESSLEEISVEVPDGCVNVSYAVAPRSIEQTASIIKTAADQGLSIVPVGSGSTLRDVEADIALVTSNLTGIIDYQPDDLTIVVGAGTTLVDLEAALATRRQSAVLPEMSPQRTVGGVVASGASGYSRLRFGPTSDRVLEVVMATGYGEVVHAGGRLVKNVTGFKVGNWFFWVSRGSRLGMSEVVARAIEAMHRRCRRCVGLSRESVPTGRDPRD